jgi:hypothetical protein
VEKLYTECFSRCGSLSTVTFESGSQLLRIDEEAFSYCSSLESISIPSSVKEIGDRCFAFCDSLSKVTFESGSRLSTVDGHIVFMDCWQLQSLVIPPRLRSFNWAGYAWDFRIIEEETAEGSE